ncbi:MAG: hypothetical protein MI741_22245 [Rhodospirillales bacterium]|nr:hypothetical protein [Rhodospirillales bacterium]
MTHSLHREGDLDKLERDFCVFIYPARGFNYAGSQPRIRKLVEIFYANDPSNLTPTSLRQNLYSEVTHDEILDSISNGGEGTRVYSTYNSRDKIKNLLIDMKEADQGISIMVSGLIHRVRELAAEVGLRPHTINLSLGIHGRTDLLPPPDIRQFTTMCGHAVVAPNLIRSTIRKVKTGKASMWDASVEAAKPCACGIYNPHRSVEQLEDTAPLYTVARW